MSCCGGGGPFDSRVPCLPLTFTVRRDKTIFVRMTEADQVTPRSWPPGSLFFDVYSAEAVPRSLARWDWVLSGSEASITIPVAEFMRLPRQARYQWVWLPVGASASATGVALARGSVVWEE